MYNQGFSKGYKYGLFSFYRQLSEPNQRKAGSIDSDHHRSGHDDIDIVKKRDTKPHHPQKRMGQAKELCDIKECFVELIDVLYTKASGGLTTKRSKNADSRCHSRLGNRFMSHNRKIIRDAEKTSLQPCKELDTVIGSNLNNRITTESSVDGEKATESKSASNACESDPENTSDTLINSIDWCGNGKSSECDDNGRSDLQCHTVDSQSLCDPQGCSECDIKVSIDSSQFCQIANCYSITSESHCENISDEGEQLESSFKKMLPCIKSEHNEYVDEEELHAFEYLSEGGNQNPCPDVCDKMCDKSRVFPYQTTELQKMCTEDEVCDVETDGVSTVSVTNSNAVGDKADVILGSDGANRQCTQKLSEDSTNGKLKCLITESLSGSTDLSNEIVGNGKDQSCKTQKDNSCVLGKDPCFAESSTGAESLSVEVSEELQVEHMSSSLRSFSDSVEVSVDCIETVDRRKSLSDRRMSPLNGRSSPVAGRMMIDGKKMSLVDASTSLVNGRVSSTDGRMSPMNERASSTDGRMSPVCEKMSPGDERMSGGSGTASLTEGRKSPVCEKMSPINERASSTEGRMSPVCERMSPVDERKPPVNGKISSADGKMSPKDGRMSPASGRMSRAYGKMSPDLNTKDCSVIGEPRVEQRVEDAEILDTVMLLPEEDPYENTSQSVAVHKWVKVPEESRSVMVKQASDLTPCHVTNNESDSTDFPKSSSGGLSSDSESSTRAEETLPMVPNTFSVPLSEQITSVESPTEVSIYPEVSMKTVEDSYNGFQLQNESAKQIPDIPSSNKSANKVMEEQTQVFTKCATEAASVLMLSTECAKKSVDAAKSSVESAFIANTSIENANDPGKAEVISKEFLKGSKSVVSSVKEFSDALETSVLCAKPEHDSTHKCQKANTKEMCQLTSKSAEMCSKLLSVAETTKDFEQQLNSSGNRREKTDQMVLREEENGEQEETPNISDTLSSNETRTVTGDFSDTRYHLRECKVILKDIFRGKWDGGDSSKFEDLESSVVGSVKHFHRKPDKTNWSNKARRKTRMKKHRGVSSDMQSKDIPSSCVEESSDKSIRGKEYRTLFICNKSVSKGNEPCENVTRLLQDVDHVGNEERSKNLCNGSLQEYPGDHIINDEVEVPLKEIYNRDIVGKSTDACGKSSHNHVDSIACDERGEAREECVEQTSPVCNECTGEDIEITQDIIKEANECIAENKLNNGCFSKSVPSTNSCGTYSAEVNHDKIGRVESGDGKEHIRCELPDAVESGHDDSFTEVNSSDNQENRVGLIKSSLFENCQTKHPEEVNDELGKKQGSNDACLGNKGFYTDRLTPTDKENHYVMTFEVLKDNINTNNNIQDSDTQTVPKKRRKLHHSQVKKIVNSKVSPFEKSDDSDRDVWEVVRMEPNFSNDKRGSQTQNEEEITEDRSENSVLNCSNKEIQKNAGIPKPVCENSQEGKHNRVSRRGVVKGNRKQGRSVKRTNVYKSYLRHYIGGIGWPLDGQNPVSGQPFLKPGKNRGKLKSISSKKNIQSTIPGTRKNKMAVQKLPSDKKSKKKNPKKSGLGKNCQKDLKEKTDKVEWFKCSICVYKTRHRHALERHEMTHTGKKIDCDQCDRGFPSNYELRLHKQTVHEKKRLACKDCDKTFTTRNGLYCHKLAVHLKQRKYKCELCDHEGFTNRGHYMGHLHKVHYQVNPYSCDKCGKTFTYKSYVKQHKKTCPGIVVEPPTSVTCNTCGAEFPSKLRLNVHLKYKHATASTFVCLCGKKYKWRTSMSTHRKKCEIYMNEISGRAVLNRKNFKDISKLYDHGINNPDIVKVKKGKKKRKSTKNTDTSMSKGEKLKVSRGRNVNKIPCQNKENGNYGGIIEEPMVESVAYPVEQSIIEFSTLSGTEYRFKSVQRCSHSKERGIKPSDLIVGSQIQPMEDTSLSNVDTRNTSNPLGMDFSNSYHQDKPSVVPVVYEAISEPEDNLLPEDVITEGSVAKDVDTNEEVLRDTEYLLLNTDTFEGGTTIQLLDLGGNQSVDVDQHAEVINIPVSSKGVSVKMGDFMSIMSPISSAMMEEVINSSQKDQLKVLSHSDTEHLQVEPNQMTSTGKEGSTLLPEASQIAGIIPEKQILDKNAENTLPLFNPLFDQEKEAKTTSGSLVPAKAPSLGTIISNQIETYMNMSEMSNVPGKNFNSLNSKTVVTETDPGNDVTSLEVPQDMVSKVMQSIPGKNLGHFNIVLNHATEMDTENDAQMLMETTGDIVLEFSPPLTNENLSDLNIVLDTALLDAGSGAGTSMESSQLQVYSSSDLAIKSSHPSPLPMFSGTTDGDLQLHSVGALLNAAETNTPTETGAVVEVISSGDTASTMQVVSATDPVMNSDDNPSPSSMFCGTSADEDLQLQSFIANNEGFALASEEMALSPLTSGLSRGKNSSTMELPFLEADGTSVLTVGLSEDNVTSVDLPFPEDGQDTSELPLPLSDALGNSYLDPATLETSITPLERDILNEVCGFDPNPETKSLNSDISDFLT